MNRRIFDWPLVNESSRNIRKRIVSKIRTAAAPILYISTRGTSVQILKAIRFFISRRFIYERSVTNIHDWSLAYSFICNKPSFSFDIFGINGPTCRWPLAPISRPSASSRSFPSLCSTARCPTRPDSRSTAAPASPCSPLRPLRDTGKASRCMCSGGPSLRAINGYRNSY